jgi:hypothetical protein
MKNVPAKTDPIPKPFVPPTECKMQLIDDIYALGKLITEMEFSLWKQLPDSEPLNSEFNYDEALMQWAEHRNDAEMMDFLRYMFSQRNEKIKSYKAEWGTRASEPLVKQLFSDLDKEVIFASNILEVIAKCLGVKYMTSRPKQDTGGYMVSQTVFASIKDLKDALAKIIPANGNRDYKPCIDDGKRGRVLGQTEVTVVQATATQTGAEIRRGTEFLEIGTTQRKSTVQKHRIHSMWPRRMWHTGQRNGAPVYMIPPRLMTVKSMVVKSEGVVAVVKTSGQRNSVV